MANDLVGRAEILIGRAIKQHPSKGGDYVLTWQQGEAAVRMALSEAIGSETGGWQPIEMASMDGRYIIAAKFKDEELIWVQHSRWITADEIAELYHDDPDEFEAGWTSGSDQDEPCFPTHWKPLDKPARTTLSGESE